MASSPPFARGLSTRIKVARKATLTDMNIVVERNPRGLRCEASMKRLHCFLRAQNAPWRETRVSLRLL